MQQYKCKDGETYFLQLADLHSCTRWQLTRTSSCRRRCSLPAGSVSTHTLVGQPSMTLCPSKSVTNARKQTVISNDGWQTTFFISSEARH